MYLNELIFIKKVNGNFKQRVKSIFFIQLMVGLVATVLVIIGWQRHFDPLFIVLANMFVIVLIILNGVERYILTKNEGYLSLTIVVGIALLFFWLWRYSVATQFVNL